MNCPAVCIAYIHIHTNMYISTYMFNVYSGFACQPAKGFIYQVARLASGTSFGPETIYNFWHAGFLPMLFGPDDTHTHTNRQQRRRSGKCKQDTKAQAMTMTRTTMRLCCNYITSDYLGLQRCLACLAWLTDFDRSSNRTINKIRPCVATMCVCV